MPVERLNNIMVVSPRAHYIQTVQGWIEELDSIEDPASEPILQVYPVRNGNAGQLASLLSTIYGGGSAGVSSASGVAPGMTQATSGGGSDGAGKRRTGGSGGGTFDLGDDVRVVSDDYNNSLLVYATPYEYQKVGASDQT